MGFFGTKCPLTWGSVYNFPFMVITKDLADYQTDFNLLVSVLDVVVVVMNRGPLQI